LLGRHAKKTCFKPQIRRLTYLPHPRVASKQEKNLHVVAEEGRAQA